MSQLQEKGTPAEQSQIDSIVSAINLISTAISIPVELPVLGKTVHFKQMTTAQEKKLVKSVAMSESSEFLPMIIPILKANCEDPAVDFDKLSMFDVYAIVLATRIYSIGSELTLRITKKNDSDKTFTTKVNLGDVYTQLIDHIKNAKIENIVVESLPYRIYCSCPTAKDLCETPDSETETVYDNLFVSMIRMVRKVEIVSNSGEIKTIDASTLSIPDRIKMFEALPSAATIKIYKEIDKFLSSIEEIMLFDFTLEGETYKRPIDMLSSDFFTTF